MGVIPVTTAPYVVDPCRIAGQSLLQLTSTKRASWLPKRRKSSRPRLSVIGGPRSEFRRSGSLAFRARGRCLDIRRIAVAAAEKGLEVPAFDLDLSQIDESDAALARGDRFIGGSPTQLVSGSMDYSLA